MKTLKSLAIATLFSYWIICALNLLAPKLMAAVSHGIIMAAGSVFDATGAGRTAPMKAGTAAPGTCTLGDTFFDTDATAGQNIYLCTATDTWTQVTAGGASVNCDPSNMDTVCIIEEFTSGDGTAAAARGGSTGFYTAAITTCTTAGQINPVSAAVNPNFGLYQLVTGGSAGNGCEISWQGTGASGVIDTDDLDDGDWYVEAMLYLLSTADIRVRVGFAQAAVAAVPTSGVWMRYDTNTSFDDDADTRWSVQACSACTDDTEGATNRVVNIGTYTPATTKVHLKMSYSDSLDKLTVTINGANTTTMCASGCDEIMLIPANLTWTPAIIVATDAAAAKTVYIDKFVAKYTNASLTP